MASLALGVVGAGIGAVFGGPFGAQMGFSAGVLLGGALFPQGQGGGRGKLDDLRVSGSGFGTMIPQLYGRGRVGGNIIWAGALKEHSQDLSGKGALPVGGGKTYWYTVSCAILVCRGPVRAIKRIWAEDRVIYDASKTPPTKHDITIYLGGEAQEQDPTMVAALGADNTPAYRGSCYVVLTNFNLRKWGNRIPNFNFEVDAGDATVGSILTDLSVQVGLEGDELAYGGADASVTGMLIAQRTTVSQLLDPVLRVYSVDLAETEGQIVAIPQGEATVRTVAAADLGARAVPAGSSAEPLARMQVRRAHDLELPSRIDLSYFSSANQYEQAVQTAIRFSKVTVLQDAESVDTPLVLTDDEARQAAEKLLYQEWLRRTGYEFSLPPRYLALAPGAPVMLPVDGADQRVVIQSLDLGLFAELRFKALADDDLILTQTVSGGTVTTEPAPFDGTVGTLFTAWSCPEVRDEDGLQAGFYVAGLPDPSAENPDDWDGAAVYYSPDGGSTWIHGGTLRDAAVFGAATTALPDWTDPTLNDTTSTVDVTLEGGALDSCSLTELDNGGNAALLGNEILGFATATQTGDENYTLDTLHRGWRDTPMTGHTAPALFVLLDHAIERIKVSNRLIGATLLVKCVADGQTLSDVTATAVTICPPGLPYLLSSGPSFDFSDPANSFYLPR